MNKIIDAIWKVWDRQKECSVTDLYSGVCTILGSDVDVEEFRATLKICEEKRKAMRTRRVEPE